MPKFARHSLKVVLGLGIIFCLAAALRSFIPPAEDSFDLSVGAGFSLPSEGEQTDTVLRVGERFPPLEAVDFDGHPVTLDDGVFGRRHTLVVFWSTWCRFCMLELPHEIELSRKYEESGLRVIGINADNDVAAARKVVEDQQIPWLNVFEGPEKKISESLGIDRWPALLLLDDEGRVMMTSQALRAVSVETAADGTDRQIDGLEWALRDLFERR